MPDFPARLQSTGANLLLTVVAWINYSALI